MIGQQIGEFVVSDQSKRGQCLGSYLKIRVALDITKPLRRCLPIQLPEGKVEWIDLRYEKLLHEDILGPEYRRPLGRRFGISDPPGWSMKAPIDMEEEAEELVEVAHNGHGGGVGLDKENRTREVL
ncbi:unnamed protein product [Prunus armeniaca]|uniref:Uncharacterized protein n=1 Tax=Prunus armeniaca TaxID=36596 RepID=A0A6J5WY64_PRUAR|nr:unnamed protein product [Prunus armeniaca]